MHGAFHSFLFFFPIFFICRYLIHLLRVPTFISRNNLSNNSIRKILNCMHRNGSDHIGNRIFYFFLFFHFDWCSIYIFVICLYVCVWNLCMYGYARIHYIRWRLNSNFGYLWAFGFEQNHRNKISQNIKKLILSSAVQINRVSIGIAWYLVNELRSLKEFFFPFVFESANVWIAYESLNNCFQK